MQMSQTGPGFETSVSDAINWHALYVYHQHEKAVAESLANHGLEGFVPLYGSVRKWKDRNKRLLLPLFPCYVFLHGGLKYKSQVLSIPGVCSFVSAGGVAATIPDAEIESIRRMVENGVAVEPHAFLRCGDRVRIKSGGLAGIEGILVRKTNSLRLILSAELLERSISVEVDADNVEPILKPASMAAAIVTAPATVLKPTAATAGELRL